MKPPADTLQGLDGFDWQAAAVAAATGVLAVLARLLTLDRASGWFLARSAFVAAVASYFVGIGTMPLFGQEHLGLWLCTVGLAGFGSPELVAWGIKKTPAALRWVGKKAARWAGEAPARGQGKAKAKRRKR